VAGRPHTAAGRSSHHVVERGEPASPDSGVQTGV
jgi:hypothetical protein